MTGPKVQVALQGGGAKLVTLLAAAEILERFHDSGEITITRVAGTSAGAIAACILASGKGVANARSSLLSKEMRETAAELSRFSKTLALFKALIGRPVISMSPISKWLDSFLQGGRPQQNLTIDKVCQMRPRRQMKLLIVSSDLVNRGSRSAPASDSLVPAIEDSCGIPFLFRTWRREGYKSVDGGLCSNLPVDFLLDKVQEEGEVLAVSFAPQPTSPHDGFLKFVAALIDTAISAGEDKARQALPLSNVLPIVTDLKTLEFERAMSDGLGELYERVKRDAEDWLKNYLNIVAKRQLALQQDPWRDKSPSSAFVMEAMGRYFEQLEAKRFIKYHSAKMLVIANSLGTAADIVTESIDVMRLELKFSACSDAIHMMSLSVTKLHEDSSLNAATLVCEIHDSSGVEVSATLIPMRRPTKPSDRQVCVCFSTPLPPNSGPYSLRYSIRGGNFMRELQLNHKDEIAYMPVRAQDRIVENLEIVLQVPVSFRIQVSEAGNAANRRTLKAAEMPDASPWGLKSYGVAAENVGHDQLWGMIVCDA